MKIRTLALFILISRAICAGDLKPMFELESTAVLPARTGNPRFKNLGLQIERRFGENGGYQDLGARLNRNVSWAEVAQGASDPTLVEAILLNKNISSTESAGPGSTLGSVRVAANAFVPVLGFGLTNRLTVALAVPVMSIRIQAATGFHLSEDGQSFLSGVNDINPYRAAELASKLNNGIQNKLATLGYAPLRSRQFTQIGDIRWVSKFRLREGEWVNWALKSEVTFPSGKAPNANELVDVPTGDGQTDLGGSVIVDGFFPHRSFRWNAYGSYVYQMPGRIERRIPISEKEPLSADKESLRRKLGDLWSWGTGLSFESTSGVGFGAGYAYQFQGGTRYRDGALASARYRLLEKDAPLQSLHSLSLTAGYSTIEHYRRKKFIYPFQANVSFNRPLKGRNAPAANLYAAELVLFF